MANVYFTAATCSAGGVTFTTYHGTREQMLAASVCTPAHFPPDKKRVSRGRDANGRWWHMRAAKRGTWMLEVSSTKEEVEARLSALAARKSAQAEIEAAPASAEQALDRLNAEAVSSCRWLIKQLRPNSVVAGAPYRVDDRTVELIEALLARVRIALANAVVVRDDAAWERLQEAAREPEAGAPPRLRAPLRIIKAA